MTSQTDFDQGGTFRQYVRRHLGPSVGWVTSPDLNVLSVTTAGLTTAAVGTTFVAVNVAGAVGIQLPSAKAPTAAPPGALPGLSLGLPMTIVDIGGHADLFNITILPFGSETIFGNSSLVISAQYGAYVLVPNLVSGGWNQQ